MGNRTFVPIQSVTLGSDTASVTFSDVPQGYRDLKLIMSVRSSHSTTDFAGLILNAVTTQTYSSTSLGGNGTAAASGRYATSANLNALFNYNLYVESTAGTWTVIEVDLMSATNTSVFKTALASTACPGIYVRRDVALWQSTAAITSIQADLYTGSFKSGSTFTLYGIGE
jgi:hypothetical protein